jgi:peptidoglycan/xylan/chitin deacetylase (PgdA/CDA1 family)
MMAPLFDRKATTCVNHPSQRSSRRCYRCLSSICKACQLRFRGHIFCGARCRNLHWAGEKLGEVRNLATRAFLWMHRMEKASERVTGMRPVRIVALAVLALLFYQAFALHRAAREIVLLRGEGAAVASAPTPAPPAAVVEASLSRQGRETVVSGPAPGYAVALLLVDGVEARSVPVREGGYSFRLSAKEMEGRSVQISLFGDALAAAYSRALPLKTPAKPAGTALPEPAAPSRPAPAPTPVASAVPVLPAAPPRVALPVAPPRAPLPPPGPPPADLARGPEEGRRIALTFDGSSMDNTTSSILEVLRGKGLKATFFLTGEFIRRYPESTRLIAEEGHEVGNHTYSHRHLTTFERNHRQDTLPGITREILQKDLADNADLYRKTTGREMAPLWRAPYGEHSETLRRWAWEAGWRHVGWTYDPRTRLSLDTLDWVSDESSTLYLSSEQMVRKVLDFGDKTGLGLAGGIVLLHLGNERRGDTLFPLARLIDELVLKGYTPCSVGELMGTTALASMGEDRGRTVP